MLRKMKRRSKRRGEAGAAAMAGVLPPASSGPAGVLSQDSAVSAAGAAEELAALNADFSAWRRLNRRIDRVLLGVLLILAVIAAFLLISGIRSETRGIINADPRDFSTLLAINPDTVAWLRIDDTPIDHPVVQGKNNFEYLDKAFEGGFYEGGTLFLDTGNAEDFSDPFSVIHGHHMAGRAMFSCLDRYLDQAFFGEHQNGTLLTPAWDFDLKLLAAGTFDAYDRRIYGTCQAGETLPEEVLAECGRRREECGRRVDESDQHVDECDKRVDEYERHSRLSTAGRGRQILALSTCTGEMNDNRVVVFWEMTNRRVHEED